MQAMSRGSPSKTLTESLAIRQFSCESDPTSADHCIRMLSQVLFFQAVFPYILLTYALQALARDVLISYFTRSDPTVSAALWEEQLRGASKVNPSAQQFFCLADMSAAAFVVHYPRDAVRRRFLPFHFTSTSVNHNPPHPTPPSLRPLKQTNDKTNSPRHGLLWLE